MKLIKIILSILLPPVAAYLQVGTTTHLWINIILTLLWGVPGMIHALWLVLTDRQAAPAAPVPPPAFEPAAAPAAPEPTPAPEPAPKPEPASEEEPSRYSGE